MLTSASEAAALSSSLRNSFIGGSLRAPRMVRYGSAFTGNAEPSLTDVMGDPMIRDLMARDGVLPESLQSLIDEIRGRLR
jgi:hypothetical protein